MMHAPTIFRGNSAQQPCCDFSVGSARRNGVEGSQKKDLAPNMGPPRPPLEPSALGQFKEFKQRANRGSRGTKTLEAIAEHYEPKERRVPADIEPKHRETIAE